MRGNTERKKMAAPIIITAAAVLLLAGALLSILFPHISFSWGEAVVTGFLVVYALVVVAIIAGVVAALCQRLREIKGGEEEDARKY